MLKMKKLVCLLALLSMSVFAAPAVKSITLRDTQNLTGDRRIPHSKLTPEAVALKNAAAFVLYDWVAYSETLPAAQAAKWRNKKVTPGQRKTRAQSLKANHQYTVISAEQQPDASKPATATVVMEERIQKTVCKYKLTLRKTSGGWVVVAFDEIK